MNRTAFDKLFSNWEYTYYTPVLWYVSLFFAIIIGVRAFRRERMFLVLFIYVLSSMTFLIVWDSVLIALENGRRRTAIIEVTNTVFSLIEATVFFYFFNAIFKNNRLKYFTYLGLTAIFIFSIILFIAISDPSFSRKQISSVSLAINSLEFLLILTLCLFYFYGLFKHDIAEFRLLKDTPSFLIVTSLFFYVLVSLPFFFIGGVLLYNNRSLYYIMFSLHYISLSLLVFCIAKALRSKSTIIY